MSSPGVQDQGVAGTLEVVIALLVFIIVLTAYFTAVAQTFQPNRRDLSPRSQAVLLSTLLMSEPGQLDDGSTDGNTSWEEFDAASNFTVTGTHNIHENLTGLGFALEGAGYGIVDREKIEAMRKVTYEQAREILGLDHEQLDFHLSVVTEEGDVVLDYGPRPREGEVHSFQRVVSLQQVNNSVVPVDFPVAEKLIINEIEYHPQEVAQGSGANEDELEWVELWNPNNFAVNVSSWHITNDNPSNPQNEDPSSDNQLRPWQAGGTLTVPPGGYAVVVGSNSRVFDFFVVDEDTVKLKMNFNEMTRQGLRPDGDNPPANPQGEKITLVDDEDKVVEFVDYRHTWGGSNYEQAGDNFTLSRIDPFADANDPANWEDSESTLGTGRGGGGTPGQRNFVTQLRHNQTQAFLTVQVFRSARSWERVLVNEIMYDPDLGEAPNEYVELYNPTDTAIDLDDWTLLDNNTEETLHGLNDAASGAQQGILPGKGYAVVTGRDRRPDVNGNFTVHPQTIWVETDTPTIGNTLHDDDDVTIFDPVGRTIDRIDYANVTGADNTGESLERIEPLGPSDMTNFDVSLADDGIRGSPGRVNSLTVD